MSRLISPHPVLGAFAVVLLVEANGRTIPVAAAVFAPFGIGYLVGNFVIGILGDVANRLSPNHGARSSWLSSPRSCAAPRSAS